MIKQFTCIECPKGCRLSVAISDGKITEISGNKCPKGAIYARSEIENPMRSFTSSVLTQGLSLKMLPVRTNKPIPRSKIFEVMAEIRKTVVRQPVSVGDVIIQDLLGLNVNLIATQTCLKEE